MPHGKKSLARRTNPEKGPNRKGRRACFVVLERLGHAVEVLFAPPADANLQRLVIEKTATVVRSEIMRVRMNDGRRAIVIVETFADMGIDPDWGTRVHPTTKKIPRQTQETAQGAP